MIRTLVLAILGSGLASAQISYGIIGGAPFSDVSKSSVIGAVRSIPKSNNFTVGPAFQVGLPLHLRIEVDALFRPYDLDLEVATTSPASIRPISLAVRGQQWRFPAMLQYRFGSSKIQPYLGAGISVGHLSGLGSAARTLISSGPGALVHETDASPVIGAGVDLKIPFIRVSGEFRYTRQSVSNFANFSNLNQTEFLLGLHF
jgi:hypothetical protein